MFDLNYYNRISRTIKYLQEDKTKGMSREHIHNLQTYNHNNKKQFWINRINEIPDEVVRDYMLLEYHQKGERALIEMFKEIQTNRTMTGKRIC
jgi:hypothetical protein